MTGIASRSHGTKFEGTDSQGTAIEDIMMQFLIRPNNSTAMDTQVSQ